MSTSLATWAADGEPNQHSYIQKQRSEVLFWNSEFDSALFRAMEIVTRYTDFERIRVYRRIPASAVERSRLVECFDSNPDAEDRKNLRTTSAKPYGIAVHRWEALLRRGGLVRADLEQFPEQERMHFRGLGLRALVLLPVKALDGFAAFESRRSVQVTPEVEIILRLVPSVLNAVAVLGPGDGGVAPSRGEDATRRGHVAAAVSEILSETIGDSRSESGHDRRNREHTLVAASRMLADTPPLDYQSVLKVVGSAAEARLAYIVATTESSKPDIVFWTSDSSVNHTGGRVHRQVSSDTDEFHSLSSEDLRAPSIALPLLSSDGVLQGFIGLDCKAQPAEELADRVRLLSVLAELFSAHFERARTRRALSESEERWKSLIESHPDPLVITQDDMIVYTNISGLRELGAAKTSDIIGRPFHDFLSATDFGVFEERRVRLERGTVSDLWEHEIIRLDGEHRIVESCCVPVVHNGADALQIILRDITDVRTAEEGHKKFFETVSEGILRIDVRQPQSVSTLPELHTQHILESGYVSECNEAMAEIFGDDIVGQRLLEIRSGFLELVVRKFLTNSFEIKNEEIFSPENEGSKYYVVNSVGHIIHDRLKSIWVSCVDRTTRVELEKNMIAALENQQQQIGRDLHDGVGQLLTGVRILSQNLVERYEEAGSQDVEVARKVARFADEASAHIREIYRGLTPSRLYYQELLESLRDLAASVDALPGVRCRFVDEGRLEIDDNEVKLHIYRIVQEAVNNALKHSGARQISIIVKESDADVVVRVTDDGEGLEKGGKSDTQIGFGSMQYRAHAVGAKLTIGTAKPRGTVVECKLDKSRR